MRFVKRLHIAFFVAGTAIAVVAITQALAKQSSPPETARAAQTSTGVVGTSVKRVKMYSGAGWVIKATTYSNIIGGVKIATANNKNQLIRIRFWANTHCRAISSDGVGDFCRVRFLIDGQPTFGATFGKADFHGSQSMENFRVFFDEPGTHTVSVQARTTNTNVWFYLSPWVATIELVNNVSKA